MPLQNPETTKLLLARLRKLRDEHPKLDFAAGFLPVVGSVQAAQDFMDKPTALGAAGIALGPAMQLAQRLRKAPAVLNADVWHASRDPIGPLEHDPEKMFRGEGLATEGPGFYLNPHEGRSLTYIGQAADINNQAGLGPVAHLAKYDLPDEELARFVKPYSLKDTHPETLQALQKLYPGKSVDELQETINKSYTPDSLLGLEGIDPHGDVSPEQYKALLEKYRAAGIPGVQTAAEPGSYLVTHFPERLRHLKTEQLRPDEKDLWGLNEWDLNYEANQYSLPDAEQLNREGVAALEKIRKGRRVWDD